MSKPEQKRSFSKSQASKLENEMKGFLGASRTTAYRAATYKPTLEKFKSTSFSDYVRGVLLGVPLDNVEPEDPYFSGDNASDDDNISCSDAAAAEDDERCNKAKQGESIERCNEAKQGDEDKDEALKILTITNSHEIKEEKKQRVSTRRMSTRSQTGSASIALIRAASEKENMYEKQYTTTSPQSKEKKSRTRVRGPPLKPDGLKLSDGIAKITPPAGWWDKAGIGKDTTARGVPWQKGEKLGDIIIPGPIKQCVAGIGGIYDFTMLELPPISVADFREKADKYRKTQMGKEVDEDESDEHMDVLARKFWKRLGPTMQPSQYGADMEGTLFDGAEACGWNVDKLESCLALLEADYKDADQLSEDFKMPGVTSAYLYFGMWASVFSAHTEDMNLLSINYLHAGAPKYWYAIAQEDSGRFESLMESMFSHQANACPQFLRHKRSLYSPSLLTKAGISYTTQVQRAGDIMITFPGCYHFGFNTGFNCAESTNFAVPEWVPFGDQAKICMCHPHSVRIGMRRFKALLNQFEDDAFTNDGRKLTYVEWAKDFIRSKKKMTQKQEVWDETPKVFKKAKPFTVEVMTLSSRRNNAEKKPTGKRKRKGKELEQDHYRLAIPIKASGLKPQTRVICLLETDKNVECYFRGSIVDVVERHAKIHFSGSSRNEDVWLTIDSGQLFVDGGSTSNPNA